jgi:putrescine transport system ATP-binding protein
VVAGFIGDINLIEGAVAAGGKALKTAQGTLRIADAAGAKTGDTVWLALRPEKAALSLKRTPARGQNLLNGKVLDVGFLGDISVYKVRVGSATMTVTAPNTSRVRGISVGDAVWVSWRPDAGLVLRR